MPRSSIQTTRKVGPPGRARRRKARPAHGARTGPATAVALGASTRHKRPDRGRLRPPTNRFAPCRRVNGPPPHAWKWPSHDPRPHRPSALRAHLGDGLRRRAPGRAAHGAVHLPVRPLPAGGNRPGPGRLGGRGRVARDGPGLAQRPDRRRPAARVLSRGRVLGGEERAAGRDLGSRRRPPARDDGHPRGPVAQGGRVVAPLVRDRSGLSRHRPRGGAETGERRAPRPPRRRDLQHAVDHARHHLAEADGRLASICGPMPSCNISARPSSPCR